jgi:hypothetical protein
VDRDGTEIGTCTQVFVDDATGLPEWAQAELNGGPAVVPLLDAAETGDRVRVAVRQVEVAEAPRVEDPMHISEDEEERLYRHYGIRFSREASESLLPVDQPLDPPAVAEDVTPAPAPVITPSEPAASTSASTSAPSSASSPTSPTSTLRERGPAKDRRGMLTSLAAGTVGTIAAVAAAVYWWRQRHQLPPTRKEMLAARAREASVALAARKEQLTAQAAPLLQSGRERSAAAAEQLSASAGPLLRSGRERSTAAAQQAAAQARVAAERAAVQARIAAEQAAALAATARTLRIQRVPSDADIELKAVPVAGRRLRLLGRRRHQDV